MIKTRQGRRGSEGAVSKLKRDLLWISKTHLNPETAAQLRGKIFPVKRARETTAEPPAKVSAAAVAEPPAEAVATAEPLRLAPTEVVA